MRHLILTHRLRRDILLGLLVALLSCVSLSLWVQEKGEGLLLTLKHYVEANLERSLGRKIRIDEIRGGLFHNLELNGLILDFGSGELASRLVIDKLILNYTFWDVLFNRLNEINETSSLTPKVEGRLILMGNREIDFSGIFSTTGNGLNIGRLSLLGGDILITGRIDTGLKECHLNLKAQRLNGEMKLNASFKEPSKIAARLLLEHISYGEFDVLSEIDCTASLSEDKSKISGEVSTRNLIVNYKPTSELHIQYELTRQALHILSARLGDECYLYGSLLRGEPPEANFMLSLQGLDVSDILRIVRPAAQDALSGAVTGYFEFKGPLDRLRTQGYLESAQGGHIGDIGYTYARLNVSGVGPDVRFENSYINTEGGRLSLEGACDFRREASSRRFAGLRLTSSNNSFVWQGWDVVKEGDTAHLSAGRNVGRDFRVTFKGFIENELNAEETNEGELELSYRLKGDDTKRVKMGVGGRGFVGLEHKVRF